MKRHLSERLVMDRLGRRHNRQAEPVEVRAHRAWWFGWVMSLGLILWAIILGGIVPVVAGLIRGLLP